MILTTFMAKGKVLLTTRK